MAKSVILGLDKKTGKKVRLAASARKLGTYIIGIQGMGKSNLLLQFTLTDIANNHGVCVLSPHTELIQDILIRIPEEKREKVVIFDPADKCPVGLNALEWDGPESGISLEKIADDVVTETFKRLWGDSWGPRMEELMSNVSRTILHAQSLPEQLRPTMAEFSDIVGTHKDTEYRVYLLREIQKTKRGRYIERLIKYWEWLDSHNPRDREAIVSSTLNKARPFSDNEIVANVVGQSKNKLNFKTIMEEGKILLVDLDVNRIGAGNVEILGSLLVGRLFLAALQRDTTKNLRNFHIIADEFGYFATPAFAALQDQARKFSVDVLVAHQRRGQLDLETKDATRTARNWIVFGVNQEDAIELSEAFDSTPPLPSTSKDKEMLKFASQPWDTLMKKPHDFPQVTELVYLLKRSMPVGVYFEDSNRIGELLGEEWLTIIKEPVRLTSFRNFADRELIDLEMNFYLYERMLGVNSKAKNTQTLNRIGDMLFRDDFTSRQDPEITEYDNLLGELKSIPKDKITTLKYNSEIKRKANSLVRMAWRKDFIQLLDYLGSDLGQAPVWNRGGQPVQEADKPRPYSDVTEEWKNRFAHLPQYEAWCRIQSKGSISESHVTTIKAIDPHEDGMTLANKIREKSRTQYGVRKEDIESSFKLRASWNKSPDVDVDEPEQPRK